ncbi:MAG: S-layer homology domain-containing protein [Syntrophomonadaceae bacterium]|nr:S-layer homology domain-containing protein [Syntrophomonadaceae bacterium]
MLRLRGDGAIQLGANSIVAGDTVYFGSYPQSSDNNGGYNTHPVKWRVLSTTPNGTDHGTAWSVGNGLLLLSNQNLDVKPYHVDNEDITWEKCTLRSWLNGYGATANSGGAGGVDYRGENNSFINAAFNANERGAILETTLQNAKNPTNHTPGGKDTEDKIFALSVAEAQDSVGYFDDNSARIEANTAYARAQGAYDSDDNGDWWLRSPGLSGNAAGVVYNGSVNVSGATVNISNVAVRPAFNLDLSKVLFISAAEGGKAVSGMDSGLAAVSPTIFTEWKLTLLDSGRDFAAATTAYDSTTQTVTVAYSGATPKTGTAPNEYISAVIGNSSGNTAYYRRIAQPTSTASTIDVDLSGIDMTSKTLYVFSEQYNGDANDNTKLTNYASALVEIPADSINGYAVTNTLTNSITSDGLPFAKTAEAYTAILTAGTGYTLPTAVTVKVGGTTLTEGATSDYTYTGGILTIGAPKITGDIEIIAAGVEPVYAIDASPATITFDSRTVGYSTAPDAQEVTITNTGNQSVTVNLPTGTNYTITPGNGFSNNATTATLTANGGTAAFSVQPKTGLAAGTYRDTLIITAINSSSATVSVAFIVNPHSGGGSSRRPASPATEPEPATDSETAPGAGDGFSDVAPTDWFYEDVTFLYERGLMVGTGEDTFDPGATATRAMLVTTLWRLEGNPAATGGGFNDVESGRWYSDAVMWAAQTGIAAGYGDGNFGVGDPITREQLAVFFYNYAQYNGLGMTATGTLEAFTDGNDVSDWAAEAMAWAVGIGLFEGYDDGTIAPQGEATRAEFAAVLHRAVDALRL